MRISDWSSDVCSADLAGGRLAAKQEPEIFVDAANRPRRRLRGLSEQDGHRRTCRRVNRRGQGRRSRARRAPTDRKSVVTGKSVSVSVVLGGRRIITKKKHM